MDIETVQRRVIFSLTRLTRAAFYEGAAQAYRSVEIESRSYGFHALAVKAQWCADECERFVAGIGVSW